MAIEFLKAIFVANPEFRAEAKEAPGSARLIEGEEPEVMLNHENQMTNSNQRGPRATASRGEKSIDLSQQQELYSQY